MTQFYVGCKLVQAWPQERNGKPGYAIKYPDGYISWSPQDVFERAYLPLDEEDGTGITAAVVNGFVRQTITTTQGKTTIVHATLANGFELVASSSCVDPENYDETLGRVLALEKVKDQVWMLLGFLLQSARHGIDPPLQGG